MLCSKVISQIFVPVKIAPTGLEETEAPLARSVGVKTVGNSRGKTFDATGTGTLG